jgi:hypothetical protein
LWRHIEDVTAFAHRNTGIVDQALKAAESRKSAVGECRKIIYFSDVAHNKGGAGAALAQASKSLCCRLILDDIVDDDILTGLGKAVGDAATNASPPASDENARALSHAKTCQSISMR